MEQNVSVLKQTELLGHQFTVYGTMEGPLFVALDVAEILKYPSNNVNRMLHGIDDEEKLTLKLLRGGQTRSVTMLTEDGLYEMLMRSTREEAKPFKKAVKKILHQIRTTGGYIPVKEEDDEMTILAKANLILQRTLERQNAQIEAKQVEIEGLQQDKQAKQLKIDALQNENSAKQEQINIQQGQIQSQANLLSQAKPKVEYYDMAMSSNLLYTTNQIALELGMSAVKLNQRLYADGVQYKQGITWILAAPYKDKGYAEIRTFEVRNFDNEVVNRKPLLKWTEKGRQFLLSKYKNNNTDNQ